MPPKPGRTPSKLAPTDPTVVAGEMAAARLAKRIDGALSRFVKAGIEWERALPGTIGRSAAEKRAALARAAAHRAVALQVRRERMDAHACTYRSIEGFLELQLKHERAAPEEERAIRRFAAELERVLAQSRVRVEAQRNAIDEEVQG